MAAGTVTGTPRSLAAAAGACRPLVQAPVAHRPAAAACRRARHSRQLSQAAAVEAPPAPAQTMEWCARPSLQLCAALLWWPEATALTGGLSRFQRTIALPSKARGCHVVTRELLKELPELSKVECGVRPCALAAAGAHAHGLQAADAVHGGADVQFLHPAHERQPHHQRERELGRAARPGGAPPCKCRHVLQLEEPCQDTDQMMVPTQDALDRIAPEGRHYRHLDEGLDDMPAHVRPAATANGFTSKRSGRGAAGVAGQIQPHGTVTQHVRTPAALSAQASLMQASDIAPMLPRPISQGRLALGTWQGIYLGEHRDHGGSRKVVVTVQGKLRADGKEYGKSYRGW